MTTLKPYPAYKDSGVLWLGQIPIHWQIKRQRAIADMLVSNVDKHTVDGEIPVRLCNYVDVYKNDHITEQIPFMHATASRAEIERFQLQLGDVLITKDSESWSDIGVPSLVKYVADDLVCGYHLALLRPRPNILVGSFLLRAIQSRGVAIQYHIGANGVTRYGLSHNAIKNIAIPIPPLEEQQRISDFLTHIDRRVNRFIRAKRRLIALLSEQKQAIIHRTVTRGLDPDVQLKPSNIKWLGEVPEHWNMLRLKDLSSRISGRLVYQPAQYFSEEGVPFIMGNNVTPEGIRWDGVRRIPHEINDRFAHHALRENDVITVRVGAPGVTCVVPKEADGLNCASVMIIRRSARFNSRWLAFTMNSGVIRTQIALVQYGAAQEQINIEDARNFLLPVPPLAEQEQIASTLSALTEPLNRAIRCCEQSILHSREYRTHLIADVVTGKLDVRGVELDDLDDLAVLDEPLADELADGDDLTDDADSAMVAEEEA